MSKSRLLPASARAVITTLLLTLAGFAFNSRLPAQANPNPPERLAYQGYLVDANGTALATNAPRNYDVIFRIWDDDSASAAGNRLWTEQQTVTVDKGYFSVILGEGSSIGETRPALSAVFTNGTASERWVSLTVKGIGPAESDVNILPRLRLLASPYAFLAAKAITATTATTALTATTATTATAVDGAALTTGTVPDARLSGNVALRAGGNTFSGNQVINNNLSIGISGSANRLSVAGNADFSGNVGIGATNPGAKLHVSGNMKIDGANTLEFGAGVTPKNPDAGKIGYGAFSSNALDIVGAGIENTSTRRLKFWAEGGSEFVGNVGIGTPNTTNKLSVGGSAFFSGNVGVGGANPTSKFVVQGDTPANAIQFVIQGNTNPNKQLLIGFNTTDNYGIIQPIEQNIGMRNLCLNPLGANVGIGTATPTQAKLQIAGSPTRTGSGLGTYWAQQGVQTWSGGTDPGGITSIYADGRIVGLGFVSHSDERIKRIAGRSDAVRDLRDLMRIEVTDYAYVDTVAKGTGQHKKLIAQQVEKVFPQAVSQSTEVVPDIYQKAVLQDGWVKLATNLKKGERVRLIGMQQEGTYEVREVVGDRFRTDFPANEGQVLVYGREVKDFRSVDYEAIAMLNVSATQELARKLEARDQALAELRAEIANLRSERKALAQSVSDLAARDQGWEARFARLESALPAGSAGSRAKAPARGSQEEQPRESSSLTK